MMRFLVVVYVAALMLTACGSDSSSERPAPKPSPTGAELEKAIDMSKDKDANM